MRRAAAVLLLLTAVPLVWADAKPGDPIRIAVNPAEAPKPSLKYRLAPDRRDLAPGNAAAVYYRAMAFFVENSALLKEIKDDSWSEWMHTPLKELPLEQVKEQLAHARHLLHEIDLGARCKDCDWQLENRSEGAVLLLPEIQSFRSIAPVLAVRARYEMAQGKWEDAIQTLQTGYAAGRHLGRGPTIIHVLIGGAFAGVMDEQLETLIQQPGAPNLYWALTDMPRPYLDAEKAYEQESRMIDRMMPWVQRLDGPALSSAQLQAVMDDMRKGIDDLASELSLVQPSEVEKLGQAFFLVQGYGEAKRGLLARDKYTAEQIEAMPEFQVTALYAYLEYRDSLDEAMKWVHAPNGPRQPGFKKSADKFELAMGRLDRLFFRGALGKIGIGFGGSLSGFIGKAYEAGQRTDRRFAALECIEALRLYAAQNGKWPDTLADLTDSPAPNDPTTGKPFDYHVQENKAVLKAPGKPDSPDALSYEVFLRK